MKSKIKIFIMYEIITMMGTPNLGPASEHFTGQYRYRDGTKANYAVGRPLF